MFTRVQTLTSKLATRHNTARILRNLRYKSGEVSKVEGKIHALGLKLPEPAVSGAFYQFIQVGDVAYLSGHLPQPAEGPLVIGKIGKDMTVEQGYEAAKMVGLNLCSTLKNHLGDLDRVKRIIKLNSFVNAVDGFTEHPAVTNGCTELFRKIFDDTQAGHCRSAVGVNGLPMGVPVEIECIVEVKPKE